MNYIFHLQVQKEVEKWSKNRHDGEETSYSLVADTDSEAEIDMNVCFKCDVLFEPEEKEIYGCDHCPQWYHKRCLPSAVLWMTEDENVLLSDIDVDCDFCT